MRLYAAYYIALPTIRQNTHPSIPVSILTNHIVEVQPVL